METLGLIQRSFPLIRIVVANRIMRLTRLCFPVKTKNKKSDRKELCVTQKSETKQELKKKNRNWHLSPRNKNKKTPCRNNKQTG